MDNKTEPRQNLCCVSCLSSDEVHNLQLYNLQCGPLKAIFQVDSISLCYICKRLAQHAELLIQNVQSNQILLENSVMVTNLQTIRAQIQPLVTLTCVPLHAVELVNCSTESFSIVENISKEVEIKVEMKEEENGVLDHLEGEFVDGDDEFQNPYIKDEDEYPLKVDKEELELDGINLMTLRESLKRKVKKKGKTKDVLKKLRKDRVPKIETLRITRKQCMEERVKMAQDQKYINCKFKCKDCLKGFNFKASYEKHLERHSESMGEFECDICKQRMDSDVKLISHRKYHILRYKCSECELIRISKPTIKDHYMAFHCQGYYQYPCPHCSKVFTRQVYLRKHITIHTNKVRVKCAYCEKTYANKDVLKTHIIVRHPEDPKELAGSDESKRYVCQECGMGFKAPSQLKIHSTKHTLTKDYYCVECDKSFKTDSILKHHLKTASPHVNYVELPLACDHCDKRFAIRRDLQRHTNRVHLNIKPFTCDKCDKAYVNGWSLTEHKRYVHEGYKRPLKYPCSMCDKVFDRKQILKGHIRTHTGERPFQCSKCPAQFSQASILGTHVKLIHLKLTRDGRPKVNLNV